MEAPMQLVGSTDDGQLFVDKKAADILSQQNVTVSVVSIVGKYRTGKSYLMNRLFQSNKGFHVGPTIEAATKGIWVWARQHPRDPSKCLILLDIEGLHDPKKGDSSHDMKLFSLAVLLSSCLVYNVVGALDNAFLQEFHLVSKLTDFIRIDAKVEETGTDFSQHFPKLFFVLRDFYLKLNLKGKEITPDEYMDDTLKLKPGRGKTVTEYNEPRECIRDFFPKRQCFALPRPVHDPEQLAHMDRITDEHIDPQFLVKVKETTDAILIEANELKVLGHIMNGPRFIQLLKVYIGGINKGTIPPIISAIENVKAKQCKIAIDKAVELYQQILESSLEGCSPADNDELVALHKSSYDMVTDHYREQAMIDVKSAEQLQTALDGAYQKFVKRNNDASREKCTKLLNSLFDFMNDPVMFQGPGGYERYTNEINKATVEYKEVKHKGPLADEMLQKYFAERNPKRETVLTQDRTMTEEKAKQERQVLARKRKLEADDHEEQLRKRLKTELMRQQEENVKLLEKMRTDFEQRQDYLMKKYQEDIKVKEEEHRRLQEENMAKQSEKMEVLLDKMHNEFQAKDDVIKKQQEQIEEFKRHTEEIMTRLQSDKLTRQEMLDTTNVGDVPSTSISTENVPEVMNIDIAQTLDEDAEMFPQTPNMESQEDIKDPAIEDEPEGSTSFTPQDVEQFVKDLESDRRPAVASTSADNVQERMAVTNTDDEDDDESNSNSSNELLDSEDILATTNKKRCVIQ